MEKEFVPYTIAVKLKKLAFNDPCFGYFDCERDFKFVQNKTKYLDCEIPRPTFSQAFRFFREKYELHSFIYSDYTWNISGGIWDLNGYKDSRYDWDSEIHTTYEEAEIDLLTNLIEIVKQHKN